MSIVSFIKTLVPGLERNEVKEDIRITKKEIDERAIPLFSDASKYFIRTPFRSKKTEEVNGTFMRALGNSRKYKNMVDAASQLIPNVSQNLSFIEEQIDAVFAEKIISSTVTYKKAVVLRAVDYIGFVSIYSLNLLTLIYHYENEGVDLGGYAEIEISKARIKTIESNVANFARILKVYGVSHSEFQNIYKSLPDVKIDEDFINAVNELKEENLDKLSVVGVQGFEGNPIYHYRLMFAEWQANRYKLNKEKKKYLELRLMQLKMKNDNEEDPGLDKEIKYLSDRIEKLEYWLHKQEDSVK